MTWVQEIPKYWFLTTGVVSPLGMWDDLGLWNDLGVWNDYEAWTPIGSPWTELDPTAINMWTAIEPTQGPGWVQIVA